MLNMECSLKAHILGCPNKNIEWALGVVQYCVFKEWVNSNNENSVSKYNFLNGVKLNLKAYANAYMLCNYIEIVKLIELFLNGICM